MSNKNAEEIRQVLSILNYKIILYSLLFYQTKGIVQVYRDLNVFIDRVHQMLSFDSQVCIK